MVGEIVVESSSRLSPIFLILLLAVVLIVGAIIFMFKKLEYNSKQVWKSIRKSFLITLVVEFVLLVVYYISKPLVQCKSGANCSSALGMFIQAIPYTIISIFLIVLLIYLVAKVFNNK
ncbi:MAG: hypothetical protein PF542_06950 [Nanoarchaeota archaeon]|jgi:hypothetical protein|nr:hypothetical protein [Nanoarchaeota archaeon]